MKWFPLNLDSWNLLDRNESFLAEEIFGEVREVEAINNEYAFITRVMKEKHFEQKLEALREIEVLSKIRVQE